MVFTMEYLYIVATWKLHIKAWNEARGRVLAGIPPLAEYKGTQKKNKQQQTMLTLTVLFIKLH